MIGIFLVGKKLLNTFGVLKSEAEQEQDKNALNLDVSSATQTATVNPNNPLLSLNPKYWKAIFVRENKARIALNKPKLTANQLAFYLRINKANTKFFYDQMKEVAESIWDSKGFFKDNTGKLYNQFQQLGSQAQISYLADVFQTKYNRDMWSYVQDFTNNEEQNKIYNIIKSKPLL